MKGFADLHVHAMAHLAFGGHFIWGSPSGRIEDALASCDGTTHRAYSRVSPLLPQRWDNVARGVLDGVMQRERESASMWRTWENEPAFHPQDGYPTFRGWPTAGTLCHQLFHVEWLRRAYDSGLRLMTCLTVNNRVIAWLMENGRESWDDETVRRQVDEMRRIATEPSNSEWMEIAYSSSDARRIIEADKLAIILGAEVDQIELFLSHDPQVLAELEAEATSFLTGQTSSAPRIEALAQTIYDVGLRQINPIHFATNTFGGSALYLDEHASNIRWLNLWKAGRLTGDSWPKVRTVTDDIEFRFQRKQLDATRGWSIFSPPLSTHNAADAYPDEANNHANTLGLTAAGKVFLTALWRRGILVDVDHMSMMSKDDTLTLAEHFGVPVISSHCWVREIVLSRDEIGMPDDWWKKWDGTTPTGTGQPTWPLLRHEGMRTHSDLERILKLGGVVGFLLRQPAVHKPKILNGADGDGVQIMGTTTASAAAYLALVDIVGPDGAVAIGSDVNGLAQLPAPSSCCSASTFDPYAPGNLKRLRNGDRIWDVNADGMAHYGMLPDLIYRWRAEGMSAELLEPLFRSAEAYVVTWARAEASARNQSLA